MVWDNNIDQVIKPQVTLRVSSIAIPQTTDQMVGKDITQTPTVNITNIYNQTVPLTTSTPATVVPDPDNIEQGYSFLGTLIRLLAAEVTNIKTAVNDYANANTAVDWSPIKSLTYSFTNKFPFSLPWDILRAVEVLTVTQDLPDIQMQFYNPLGVAPIQFTLDWPEFVGTFALGLGKRYHYGQGHFKNLCNEKQQGCCKLPFKFTDKDYMKGVNNRWVYLDNDELTPIEKCDWRIKCGYLFGRHLMPGLGVPGSGCLA